MTDDGDRQSADGDVAISIHIPRGGDDKLAKTKVSLADLFQSTSPVGGMTYEEDLVGYITQISIHIPRGGDDIPQL